MNRDERQTNKTGESLGARGNKTPNTPHNNPLQEDPRIFNKKPPTENQVDISVGHAGQTSYRVSIPLLDFNGLQIVPIDPKNQGVLVKSIGVSSSETVINIAEAAAPWELKLIKSQDNADPTTKNQTAGDDENGDFIYDLPSDKTAPEIRIKRWIVKK